MSDSNPADGHETEGPLGSAAAPADVSEAGAVDQDPSPDQEITAEFADTIAKAAAERDEYLDALRRLQADFENYRKRVSAQQEELVARAALSLVEKLLPALDTMDLALAHDPSGSLEQVISSVRDVLAKEGLEPINATGVEFDPTVHDAVAHEPGDNDPEVIEIMRAGYQFKGKVIRPAMVKVKGH